MSHNEGCICFNNLLTTILILKINHKNKLCKQTSLRIINYCQQYIITIINNRLVVAP